MPLDEQTPSDTCQESAGFLFKHPCGYLAESTCGTCGKALCSRHTRCQPEGVTCIACGRRTGSAGSTRGDRYDPYEYSSSGYPGYGYYGPGHWGSWWFLSGSSHRHDRHDFTEADSASLVNEGDANFEQAMGES